jgi:hypothetical protein
MRVVGLVGGTALHSHDACCLHWHLHLDNSATNVVILRLDLVMVATRGALIGLTLGISMATLGIGACGCMERMIHLLSLVWGMGYGVWECLLVHAPSELIVCCKNGLG